MASRRNSFFSVILPFSPPTNFWQTYTANNIYLLLGSNRPFHVLLHCISLFSFSGAYHLILFKSLWWNDGCIGGCVDIGKKRQHSGKYQFSSTKSSRHRIIWNILYCIRTVVSGRCRCKVRIRLKNSTSKKTNSQE